MRLLLGNERKFPESTRPAHFPVFNGKNCDSELQLRPPRLVVRRRPWRPTDAAESSVRGWALHPPAAPAPRKSRSGGTPGMPRGCPAPAPGRRREALSGTRGPAPRARPPIGQDGAGVTSGPAPPPSGPAPRGGLAVWSGAAETGLSGAASCRSAPPRAAWGSAGEARTAGARLLGPRPRLCGADARPRGPGR